LQYFSPKSTAFGKRSRAGGQNGGLSPFLKSKNDIVSKTATAIFAEFIVLVHNAPPCRKG